MGHSASANRPHFLLNRQTALLKLVHRAPPPPTPAGLSPAPVRAYLEKVAFQGGRFKFAALELVAGRGVTYRLLFELEHSENWTVPAVLSSGITAQPCGQPREPLAADFFPIISERLNRDTVGLPSLHSPEEPKEANG